MVRKSTFLSLAVAAVAAGMIISATQLWAQEVTETPDTTTTAPKTLEDQPQEIKDAIAKFQQRDFAGALESVEKAVKNNPDLPPARIIMAQFFLRFNMASGVRSSLEAAVKEVPSDPEAYVVLGDFALRERRITEAGLLYEKGGEVLGTFTGSAKRKGLLAPRVLAGMAAVAEARGNWPEVQKHVEAWLKIAPESSAAMQRLGRALFKQDQPKEALDMLKKAAAADPNVLTPGAILATFYEQADDRANATKWMEYAVKAAPKDLKTHLVATQWAIQTNQIDRAQELAKECVDLDPKSVDANVLLGVINLFKGDYKSAEGYFQNAHMQAPDSFAVTNNLALAMVEQGDESKKQTALAYATENVRKYPRVGEAYSTYGWVLYKRGRLNEAGAALQRAIQMGNPSNDTMYFFARALADSGKAKEAKTLLGVALKNEKPFSKRADAQKLHDTLNPE